MAAKSRSTQKNCRRFFQYEPRLGSTASIAPTTLATLEDTGLSLYARKQPLCANSIAFKLYRYVW